MGMFDDLKTDSSVQEVKDVLGGSGPLDSDGYDAVIDVAYADVSSGGARSLNVSFKINGRTVKQTLWMTSGTAKGCKNYYEANGQRKYLPGFVTANDLCLLSVGKPISDLDTEPKTIKVYDPAQGKEAPMEKAVVVDLIGQPIKLGILKQLVDKNVKNAQGNYVPSGETREINEIDKVFRSDGFTVPEIKAQATEPSFYSRWVEKNRGTVVNKAKGASADAGTSGMPTPAAQPTTSLFGQ